MKMMKGFLGGVIGFAMGYFYFVFVFWSNNFEEIDTDERAIVGLIILCVSAFGALIGYGELKEIP